MPFNAIKKHSEPLNKKRPGFTLIELVVVITILAILGTIGFMSIWGYSSRARDSSRLGDVALLTKSLDLGIINSGNYPMPDNYFTVTYSGGAVWYQGTAGAGVVQKLHNSVSGGGLDSRPTDPLKGTEFAYSTLAFGKAYQIKTEYEGDLSGWKPGLVPMAAAAPGVPTIAYIKGNYGGLAAKTVTGSTTYVLAVPSIVTGSGIAAGTSVEVSGTALSGTLQFHGKNLVGASSFNPGATTSVVFSGSSLPSSDTTGQITAIMNNLKAAYSGSDIASSNVTVSTLLSTTSGTISSLGTTIITSQLGGTTTPSSTTAVNCSGAWGTCGALCTQTYSITTPASGGGLACATLSGAVQACTGGSCPTAGTCNNTVTNGCTFGSAINQSAGSCGGTATWNCSTAGGTSAQCSKANASCCVANVGQSCDNGYNTPISGCNNGSTCIGMWVNGPDWGGCVMHVDPICQSDSFVSNPGPWVNQGGYGSRCNSTYNFYITSWCTSNVWTSVPGTISCNGTCQ